MKISRQDRLQGMIHSEIFRKDLRDTLFPFPDRPQERKPSWKKIRRFEERWGIPVPKGNSVEECIEFMQRLPLEAIFNDPPAKIVQPNPQTRIEHGIFMDYGVPIKDNILHLDIDMTANTDAILRDVKEIVGAYKRALEQSDSRDGKPEINIWDVYRMHNKESLSFSDIARRLSGRNGNPSTDAKLMSYYKRVKYAYNKASKIIDQIEKPS